MASHNLEMGAVIKEADIKVGDWAGPLPAGATSKSEDLIGRGVTAAIYNNEPVLESRLAPRGAGGGLAAMIPKGMRAVAVRVNEVVGVAGFVVPGMRVDVLISGNPPGNNANVGSVTRTLLQNIEVLSAGQDFKKDAEGKPIQVQVINLLVTPDQAEMLSLAANTATIQLVLRNPLDTQVAQTAGTAMARLFNPAGAKPLAEAQPAHPVTHVAPRPRPAAPAPVARPEPPKPFVMEVINGNRKTETKFDVSTEGK
jgi:pilus assembly protein CpaB